MSRITLNHLSKHFKDLAAVRDVSLEIESGEFLSILGASGCGKTTLLRMIAGFERPTAGTVCIDDRDVTNALPQNRGVGMVFQNYALFPHMTVRENVAFGLETRKLEKREIRRRVDTVLKSVNLLAKSEAPVPHLSGGEQQRVAVARAIVVEPAVLLMDEPLSNLDVSLRLKTREEIRLLQRRIGITTIYVTHDQSEAMSLSDRIAVMDAGRIAQVGTPVEMYEKPTSAFVAGFLGGANVLAGTVSVADRHLQIADLHLTVPPEVLGTREDGEATLVIKPEGIQLSSPLEQGDCKALVVHKEYLGFTTNLLVEAKGVSFRITSMSAALPRDVRPGDEVTLRFDWSRSLLLPPVLT